LPGLAFSRRHCVSGWFLGEEVGKQFGEKLDRAPFALGVQRKEDGWEDPEGLATMRVICGVMYAHGRRSGRWLTVKDAVVGD
jgi:hypothetical protein